MLDRKTLATQSSCKNKAVTITKCITSHHTVKKSVHEEWKLRQKMKTRRCCLWLSLLYRCHVNIAKQCCVVYCECSVRICNCSAEKQNKIEVDFVDRKRTLNFWPESWNVTETRQAKNWDMITTLKPMSTFTHSLHHNFTNFYPKLTHKMEITGNVYSFWRWKIKIEHLEIYFCQTWHQLVWNGYPSSPPFI